MEFHEMNQQPGFKTPYAKQSVCLLYTVDLTVLSVSRF